MLHQESAKCTIFDTRLLSLLSPTVVPNSKIPPKIKFKKGNNFVKMTGHTHVCNSLTNFFMWSKRNHRKRKIIVFAEICSWNDNRVTYFWRVLGIWNYCESPDPSPGLSCLACYFLVDSSFSIRGIPKQIIAFSMVFPPCHPAFTYLASHKL